MEGIISSLDTVVSVSEKVWTIISGNPLLSTFAAVGLLCSGIGVFACIKRASH